MTTPDLRQQLLTALDPDAAPGCLIIGEVAQAHDGSLGLAHAFVDAIADAGADAVKFQTHIADAESTPDEPWRIKFSPQDETRFDYWRRMEFAEPQWQALKEHAEKRGLLFLSSPFSDAAVTLLEGIGIAAWKIASGEVGNLPLLRRIVSNGRPVLLSTGMSDVAEIDAAVEVVRAAGVPLAVMQCTSAYPCSPEKVGLDIVDWLRQRYGCPAGLSDHSGTVFPGLAGAALGLDVLEVHITLSREMFGPDVVASVTTDELRQLVEGVRFIEAMRANPIDKDAQAERLGDLRQMFTKSIVTDRELPAGTVLEATDLTLKKPGSGMPPERLEEVVGRRLLTDLPRNQRLHPAHLAPPPERHKA